MTARPARPTPSLAWRTRSLFRSLSDAAMRLRPGSGIFHEFLGFLELGLIELAALFRRLQHVPPGGEEMQRDTEITQNFLAVWKDAVKEHNEAVFHTRPGPAQRLAEIDLAAAVAGHILDQQHTI